MDSLFPAIIKAFREDVRAALATLTKRSGSTPRDTGTRFLVLESGEFHGTIGGGLLEARVLQEARRVIESGQACRLSFQLTGSDVANSDMLCGGEGEVFLEPLSPDNLHHLGIYERINQVLQRGGSGLAATALDPERWIEGEVPKMFLESDGSALGSLLGHREMPADLIHSLARLQGRKRAELVCLEDDTGSLFDVLVEPIQVDPALYIFGGGHVSSEIVPLAARVGFKVVVMDDRDEFADPARFPEAHEVRRTAFEGVFENLAVDPASYLVIVTRGHIHDMTVLRQALRSDARYVGMIGSSRKIGIIYERLMEEGATREQIERVHAPIGLDIGAETPEEIAVSIVAELIKARAGGGKRHRTG